MSHIATIELKIQSLDDLKQACERLGFTFMENQRTYKWYGEWMGDTELPEGVDVKDLGKCDHAIKVPGSYYEVGVIARDGNYSLIWDYWSPGGLTKKIGQNAGIIKQAYTAIRVRREAMLRKYQVREQKTEKGLRLVLTC